jgi:hypothetical protein
MVRGIEGLFPESFWSAIKPKSARVRTDATYLTVGGKKCYFGVVVGRVNPLGPTYFVEELANNSHANPRTVASDDVFGLLYPTMLNGYICIAGPFSEAWEKTDIFNHEDITFRRKSIASNQISEAMILLYARSTFARELRNNKDIADLVHDRFMID